VYTAVAAHTAHDALGPRRIAPAAGAIKGLSDKGKLPNARYSPYVPRLLEDLRAGLK
jgi:hypothetical protein